MLLTAALSYFLVLQWLPIGPIIRKASLWMILGIPGIWWIDLQIDGVRRGYGTRTLSAALDYVVLTDPEVSWTESDPSSST